MQAEGIPHLGQLGRAGLEQAQPDEAVLLARPRGVLERDRSRFLPAPVLVVGTIDDHLGALLSQPPAGGSLSAASMTETAAVRKVAERLPPASEHTAHQAGRALA